MNVYQRYLAKGDRNYYGRFTAPNPHKPGTSKRYLRNLDTVDKEEAETRLRKLVKSMKEGRFEVVELTKLRHEKQTTLAELFEHYRRGARQVKDTTVKLNINAVRNICRRVHFPDLQDLEASNQKIDQLSLSTLDGRLIRDWKQKVLDQVEAEDADEEREQQIQRTANSILRQARSLFAGELRDIYDDAGIELPDGIRDFCDRPGFTNTGKTDYWPPSDIIIEKTFTQLDTLPVSIQAGGRNMYLAIWLALGAGLRKSEIGECRNSWFITRDGIVFIRGDVLAKNGTVPDVRLQLGAWEKIQPFLRGDAESYVLEGTATERHEDVTRRIGAWMRTIGWETQKTIHEFRAFAGSKIAEAEGLLAAQAFLRHRSYSTTEKYYMRYMRVKMKEVKLVLPSTPALFTPQVLPRTAQA
jgi:integrase